MNASPSLSDQINDLLPQTQCTKCGYGGCRPYADAIANGTANYNQCPPGGQQGVARLASLLNKPIIPLNPINGVERVRLRAVIDETLCIGCTLCMKACPVDAIVGAPKQLHTVLLDWCTGCDLCVSPCPVNCIEMIPVTTIATGWDAWSPQQAVLARRRHEQRNIRLIKEQDKAQYRASARRAMLAQMPLLASEYTLPSATTISTRSLDTMPIALPKKHAVARKKAIIKMALARTRKKKEELAAQGIVPGNTSDLSPAIQAKIDLIEARRQRLGCVRDEDSLVQSEEEPPLSSQSIQK
ncbi:electron transport complex subunit RsxB [Candidatus Vallotia lariciata]|uniref:electron transport complex subunit RsxB n=1 Tax=Candidatus Vallotia laricis TaxID=2018052 RepID=UPI001D00476B|nr:electron transport complex subunit RsxB [Candidatus Vallotia lariciata]UDG82915.1 Electron transport complex subunit RsxB [Candidatus Vallotia lariciata]